MHPIARRVLGRYRWNAIHGLYTNPTAWMPCPPASPYLMIAVRAAVSESMETGCALTVVVMRSGEDRAMGRLPSEGRHGIGGEKEIALRCRCRCSGEREYPDKFDPQSR